MESDDDFHKKPTNSEWSKPVTIIKQTMIFSFGTSIKFLKGKEHYIMKLPSISGKKLSLAIVVLLILFGSLCSWASNVEWGIKQTLDLKKTPIDVAVSPDWQKLFILTDEGEVQIYSGNGVLIDKINVGTTVDDITAGPQGSVLILKSSQDKKIQIVSLDFIQNINVSGSPFKGSPDAPVVIAVFSDFE